MEEAVFPSGGMKARFGGHELELEYPCRWTYTLVGSEEWRMRAAAADVLGDLPHTVTFSHHSRTGRYCSLHLVLTVESDEQRLAIYEELCAREDVRYVL